MLSWKVNPFFKPKAGETVILMDVDGPGIIQHIWMATNLRMPGDGRACVLRFHWDGEDTPSIQVPMTGFSWAMTSLPMSIHLLLW